MASKDMGGMRGSGPGSIGKGPYGSGSKPTGASISRQNKSAKTYISKSEMSSAKRAANANTSARMKRVMSKSRTFNKAVTAAGITGVATGYVFGAEQESRRKKNPSSSEPNRKNMAMSRAKGRIKQNARKS